MITPNHPIRIDDPIICPKRGRKEKPLPRSGFFIINQSDAALAHSLAAERRWELRHLPYCALSVAPSGDMFFAGPAVSSPIAVMVMEKLIALGAERVVALSWCGSISPDFRIGEVLVGGTPLSGEGTSQYYATGEWPEPSLRLQSRLISFTTKLGLAPRTARIWTTDAPYRESRAFLEMIHQREGICGVDMEYSALCAVSVFRRIEFASLFVVSDELWGVKWIPGFKNSEFLRKNRVFVEAFFNWGSYVD